VLAGSACFTGDGDGDQLGRLRRLTTAEFKRGSPRRLAPRRVSAAAAVNYKLRDWLFSRQRFWGEPFPILHELDDEGKPTGLLRAVAPRICRSICRIWTTTAARPPRAAAGQGAGRVAVPGDRRRALPRETNTMPQWAGSCWYYLRFIDPRKTTAFVDPEKERAWMPVDLYVGGAEHAVLHLLYARFWHKVLYDRGLRQHPEPFQRLVNQGMILGENGVHRVPAPGQLGQSGRGQGCRRDAGRPCDGMPVGRSRSTPTTSRNQGENFVLRADPSIRIDSRAYKMSKSRGNVVNPDESSGTTARIRCGCTRCSWARWKRPSRGAWPA
jgi:leucyl-tRNA synthetase